MHVPVLCSMYVPVGQGWLSETASIETESPAAPAVSVAVKVSVAEARVGVKVHEVQVHPAVVVTRATVQPVACAPYVATSEPARPAA